MRITTKQYWIEITILAIITVGLLIYFQHSVVYQALTVVSGVMIAIIAGITDIPQIGKSPPKGENPHKSEEGVNTKSIFTNNDNDEENK